MNTSSNNKLTAISYFLIAIVVALSLRLYFLQIMSGEIFAQAATESITRVRSTAAPRGNIYDRNGKLLVESIPTVAVAVDPYTVLAREDVMTILSSKLKIPYQDLRKKLEDKKTTYIDRVIIKYDIDKETLVYLKENSESLPGVEVVNIFLRQYNYGYLAAHILGYTGEITEEMLKKEKNKAGYEGGDQVGLTGVEAEYEDILQGIKGKIVYEVDPLGRPTDIIEQADYIAGNDIYLTIDIELQRFVEELLATQLEQIRDTKISKTNEYYNAGGGAAVVMDVKTGEILAMASNPTYDPGVFVGGISFTQWEELNKPENRHPLNNRAIMGFPPGSVFKIAPAYAGLSEDIINNNTTFNCAGTWYGLGSSYPKTCWSKGGHGGLSIQGAIQNSCDIFFYELGLRLYLKNKNADELLQKYCRILGYGSQTGLDLPNEESGIIPDRDWKKEWFKNDKANSVWFPGDTVNMAIGQGDVLVTPLQVAYSYMAIADRGIQHIPHVLKDIGEDSLEQKLGYPVEEVKNLNLNQDYLSFIEAGLYRVVKQGTAASAFSGFPLDEFPVAGKTGTAEFAGRQDYAWFSCYAPINNPKYVIAIVLEEAGGGGKNVAPIARRILEYLFNIESSGKVRSVESYGD